jgi:hypothetical protein
MLNFDNVEDPNNEEQVKQEALRRLINQNREANKTIEDIAFIINNIADPENQAPVMAETLVDTLQQISDRINLFIVRSKNYVIAQRD